MTKAADDKRGKARILVFIAIMPMILSALSNEGWSNLKLAMWYLTTALISAAGYYIATQTRRPMQSWLWLLLAAVLLGVLLILLPALNHAPATTLVTQVMLWAGMVGIASGGVYWLEHVEPRQP